jgi:hypothetical protein
MMPLSFVPACYKSVPKSGTKGRDRDSRAHKAIGTNVPVPIAACFVPGVSLSVSLWVEVAP